MALSNTENIITAAVAELKSSPDYVAEPDPADEEGGETPEPADEDATGDDISLKAKDTEPEPAIVPPGGAEGVVVAPEDAFAKEHGLPQPVKGKVNKLPYDRVVKITDNAKRKTVEDIIGRPFAENETIEQAVTGFKTSYTEATAKLKDYEPRIASMDAVEPIMVHEPKRFAQMLIAINPEYADLFKGVADQGVVAEVPAPASTIGPMPKPDYDLGGGKMTYSPEGLTALLEWNTAKSVEAAEIKIAKRYEPIEKQHQQRENALRVEREMGPKIAAAVDHARQNRRLFKENEPAILALITADHSLSIDDAWWKVVQPILDDQIAKANAAAEKAKPDAAKMRAELLKEIAAAPTSTSAGGTIRRSADDDPDRPKSTEDHIREAIAKHKKG